MSRFFDVILAAAALLFLSPLLVFAALAIRINDNGPIFYMADRVGKDSNTFAMYKLRTMSQRSTNASQITAQNDNRVTSVGRYLRRTKIDELPQIFNILRGDMAIVGPRPESVSIVEDHYTAQMREVLTAVPGLTSPGTIYNENASHLIAQDNTELIYATEILPKRIELDLAYLKTRTWKTDISLIIKTIWKIIRPTRWSS